MKTFYVLLFLSVCTPLKNKIGASEQMTQEKQNEVRTWELKQKYPPDDHTWMYEISKEVQAY